MTNPWDERYKHDRYFYGTEPNVLVREALAGVPPGHGLYVAEGEGRNAVYAASLGHRVTAFDGSTEARRKAVALAAERGVTLEYLVCDAADSAWSDAGPFDHAVLCFFHPTAEMRAALHARVAASLKPGGTLIVVSYAKEQFGRGTGGPPKVEMLHALGEIRGEFPGVAWSRAEKVEVELAEGTGHVGVGAVNVLVGRAGA